MSFRDKITQFTRKSLRTAEVNDNSITIPQSVFHTTDPTETSLPIDTPIQRIVEGYLYKRGRGKSVSFIKPWGHRYCKLDTHTGTLQYYAHNHGKYSLRGSIIVSNCTVHQVPKERSGRLFSFEIICPINPFEDERLTLAALDLQHMNMWIQAFQYCGNIHTNIQISHTDDNDCNIQSNHMKYTDISDEVHSNRSQLHIDCKDIRTSSYHDQYSVQSVYSPTSACKSEPVATPIHPDRFNHLVVNPEDYVINVDEICGTGGYGIVIPATLKTTQKKVALKFFGYSKRNPESLSILEAEVDVMSQLKGVDGFVQLEGFFYDTVEGMLPNKNYLGDFPVIVMEHLETDLLSYLSTTASAEDTIRRVFRELITVLMSLHDRGYLHRDLKVDNIMISSCGHIKLIDFGLLVSLDDGKSEFKGQSTGTIGYFAPESIPTSGKATFSAKSDIWQAGVVLYTLLCGKLPFNISSFNIRKGKYSPMSGGQWDNRSDACKDLIRRIFTLKPAERICGSEILEHEWLAAPDTTRQGTQFDGEYVERIQKLAVRRNVRKMLRSLQDDDDEEYDRTLRAESILEAIVSLKDESYARIRAGALKTTLLEGLHSAKTHRDTVSYEGFSELVRNNAMPELASAEIYSKLCDGSDAPLSYQELILTLMSMCSISDQIDDAFVCFLKFDMNQDGVITKDEMDAMFRTMFEEEAAICMDEGSDDLILNIEEELNDIENVFNAMSFQSSGKVGFDEFRTFYDTVMKISSTMSTRMSMRNSVRMSMRTSMRMGTMHMASPVMKSPVRK